MVQFFFDPVSKAFRLVQQDNRGVGVGKRFFHYGQSQLGIIGVPDLNSRSPERRQVSVMFLFTSYGHSVSKNRAMGSDDQQGLDL